MRATYRESIEKHYMFCEAITRAPPAGNVPLRAAITRESRKTHCTARSFTTLARLLRAMPARGRVTPAIAGLSSASSARRTRLAEISPRHAVDGITGRFFRAAAIGRRADIRISRPRHIRYYFTAFDIFFIYLYRRLTPLSLISAYAHICVQHMCSYID